MEAFLSAVGFGELYQYKNLGIIPMFSGGNYGPRYMVLKEAQEQRLITITEVDQGGSVPELKVINKGNLPVLLLDGEELIGAKQNRVLNSSILLKKYSETIIPVSCTEHGRWSYTSREFKASDSCVPSALRTANMRAVNRSLNATRSYRGNQGIVWNRINEMHNQAGTCSDTGALRHMFDARQENLNDYQKAFPLQSQQKGLMVFINGEVVGFDLVSQPSVYQQMHAKLIRSYAMDGLLMAGENASQPTLDKAQAFVDQIPQCSKNCFSSVGNGWDHRYESKGVVGSSLVYRKTVIHAAFFKADENDKVDSMAGFRRRRRFHVS